MKSKENPKFEESWKEVFAGAEANPPDTAWTNIDLQLSRAESGDMKRRVVFYQRLAAASAIFALALGSTGVWYWRQDVNQELAANEVNSKMAGKEMKELDTGAANDKKVNENEVAERIDKAERDKDRIEHAATKIVPGGNNVLEKDLDKTFNESNNGNIASIDYKPKEGATNGGRKSFIADQTLAGKPKSNRLPIETVADDMKRRDDGAKPIDFAEQMIFLASSGLPETEAKPKGKPVEEVAALKRFSKPAIAKKDTKKKQNNDENWWASVGGSAGSYNAQAATGGSPSFASQAFLDPSKNAALSAAPISNRADVGTSFSFGMTFGKKVAQRWVVLSGVNYLSQSIGYNSNIAVVDANNRAKAYALDFAMESANITTTSPYTINSVSEFVSIPLQAGYLIVDRKMGVQLNTGIATDFFVKNTLTDESGRLSDYSESVGTNSTYQTLNWAGLVGTELSYKMAKHYRVSLVPGLRYSFNSILKPSTGNTLTPMVWDVGFRFRYIF